MNLETSFRTLLLSAVGQFELRPGASSRAGGKYSMLSGESSRVALGYEALLNNMGTEALTSVDCFAYVTQTAYVQHMTVDCFLVRVLQRKRPYT